MHTYIHTYIHTYKYKYRSCVQIYKYQIQISIQYTIQISVSYTHTHTHTHTHRRDAYQALAFKIFTRYKPTDPSVSEAKKNKDKVTDETKAAIRAKYKALVSAPKTAI